MAIMFNKKMTSKYTLYISKCAYGTRLGRIDRSLKASVAASASGQWPTVTDEASLPASLAVAIGNRSK